MRLVKITGGLGNQLFIYAFYLALRERYPNTRLDLSDIMHYHVHNGYELQRVFPDAPVSAFCIPQWMKKVVEALCFRTILERHQHSLDDFFRPRPWPLIYYKGFFQSERYFLPVADKVRAALRFPLERTNADTRRLLQQIDADPEAVSPHVRRGDYLQPKVYARTGCICQREYYLRAIGEMTERVPRAHYYVFSDDIEWVRQNLPLPADTVYVDHNHGEASWQDMMLMSHCRHHVICNSTFSWWGAYLNAAPTKVVISPERWDTRYPTPHINPAGWVTI